MHVGVSGTAVALVLGHARAFGDERLGDEGLKLYGVSACLRGVLDKLVSLRDVTIMIHSDLGDDEAWLTVAYRPTTNDQASLGLGTGERVGTGEVPWVVDVDRKASIQLDGF